jgi:hypothetical protein
MFITYSFNLQFQTHDKLIILKVEILERQSVSLIATSAKKEIYSPVEHNTAKKVTTKVKNAKNCGRMALGQRTSCPNQLFLIACQHSGSCRLYHHTLPHLNTVRTIQTTFESSPATTPTPKDGQPRVLVWFLLLRFALVITTMSIRPPCTLSILCVLHRLRRSDVGR